MFMCRLPGPRAANPERGVELVAGRAEPGQDLVAALGLAVGEGMGQAPGLLDLLEGLEQAVAGGGGPADVGLPGRWWRRASWAACSAYQAM